jgi:hypothetical protein
MNRAIQYYEACTMKSCRTYSRESTTPEVKVSSSRLLYDRKQAAAQLSISVRSLDYLIQQQQIATRRIGKKVLIHHTELTRFARGNHTVPIRRCDGDE